MDRHGVPNLYSDAAEVFDNDVLEQAEVLAAHAAVGISHGDRFDTAERSR